MTRTEALRIRRLIRSKPDRAYKILFGCEPVGWLVRVLKALFVQGIRHICVTGGFATGKTYEQPRLAMMWIWAYAPEAIVPVCAPKAEQVKDHFWKEFKVMHAENPGLFGGELFETEWRSGKPKCYVKTMVPGQRSGPLGKTAYTGFGTHAENVLGLMDDGQGNEQAHYDAFENATSTGKSAWVVFANPQFQGGALWGFVTDSHCVHEAISALEHPNVLAWREGLPPPIPGAVAGDWVDRMVHKHCKAVAEGAERSVHAFRWYTQEGRLDSDGKEFPLIWFEPDVWFIGNVMGQFPDISQTSLITYEQARQAAMTKITPVGDPVSCGLDPAEWGTAETVFTFRYATLEGPWFHRQAIYPGRNDPDDIKGTARQFLLRFPRMKFIGDAIGVGSAVMASLVKEFPEQVMALKWSPKAAVGFDEDTGMPLSMRFKDFKTQLHFSVASKFRDGLAAIEDDPELISQIAACKHGISADGRQCIVAKSNQSGEQWDRWESLCLSHAGDLLGSWGGSPAVSGDKARVAMEELTGTEGARAFGGDMSRVARDPVTGVGPR